MPDTIRLQVQPRTLKGKQVGRLRRAGIIPANIYGRNIESIPVQIDSRSLRDVLVDAGTSTVVEVHLEGTDGAAGVRHPVLIEHVQLDPATGHVVHVDLHRVELNRPMRASVPVTLTGEAPAVKIRGGVLVQQLDTIEVEALPNALPHGVEADVSSLDELESQITVADLRLPAGVTVHSDGELVIARVMPSKLELEVAAEVAEAAETTAAEAAEAAEGAAEDEGRTQGGEA